VLAEGLVGIEGGVVSGVINLESSSVEAPGRRPRHDERYHEARAFAEMLSLAVRRVQADAGSPSTRPGNGEDLRPRPLSERKVKLARLLARARAGIALNGHTEEDGAVVSARL
jgi:hypothetical protein